MMLLGRNMICVLGVMSYSNKSISIRASPLWQKKMQASSSLKRWWGISEQLIVPTKKGSSAVVRKTSILFLFWLQIYRFLLEIKKICSCFEQYGLTLELCRLTNHLYLCCELKIGK